MESCITYADVITKQAVQDWAGGKGFDAEDQICLHLKERFSVRSIQLIAAIDQGDFLLLQLTTDCWEEPREFALLSDGALSW
ncbi:MAG: hypothetical protein JSS27_15970 [Planctomycetes bacterium]|nr:hypothetical protein [Planctomycetota bacterium]